MQTDIINILYADNVLQDHRQRITISTAIRSSRLRHQLLFVLGSINPYRRIRHTGRPPVSQCPERSEPDYHGKSNFVHESERHRTGIRDGRGGPDDYVRRRRSRQA